MEINNCTRCGENFTDFRVDVSFQMKTDRLKDDTMWECVPNLDVVSREVLCLKCYYEFAALLEEMNRGRKYQKPENNNQPVVESGQPVVDDSRSKWIPA
jgi:hypothetical protein